MISRRLFLGGLICAPAIVRAESLMRVVPTIHTGFELYPHQLDVLRELRGLQNQLAQVNSSHWNDFNCEGTTSGRFTSNAPNLSNVPKSGGNVPKAGGLIQVPKAGGRILVGFWSLGLPTHLRKVIHDTSL